MRKSFLGSVFPAILLIIILLFIPFILSNPYYLGIAVVTLINVMLAVSIWIILKTGQVSLCHVGFSAIGGYFTSALVMSYQQSFWTGLAVGMVIAGIAALIIGLITLRLKSHYFFIVTACFGEIIKIVFGMIEKPFGGLSGIVNLPPPDPIHFLFLPEIKFDSTVSYYYLVLGATIIMVFLIYKISSSWIGDVFNAIRQNEERAENIGINTMAYKVLAFVVGSIFASIIGALSAFNTGCMLPTTFGFWEGIYCLIYVSVGGGMHIAGPIIGAVFFSLLSQLLKPVQMWEPVIYGTALILVMMFFRRGLLGGIQDIYSYFINKIRLFHSGMKNASARSTKSF